MPSSGLLRSLSLCVGLYLGLLAATLGAATPTTFVPLGSEDEPRPVLVNLVAQEYTDIKDADQTFSSDFYVLMYYQAPELLSLLAPGQKSVTVDASAIGDVLEVELKNRVDADAVYETKFNVYATMPSSASFGPVASNASWPWVEMDMRFRGTFRSQFDLKAFPFDTQSLVLSLEFTRHTSLSFYFQARAATGGLISSALVEPTGFNLREGSSSVREIYYPSFNQTYSRFDANVIIKREAATVYGVRIISTLLITTMMTFFLYIFPITETTRHGNAATFFLASVAYMFTVSSDLPKVPYTTRLDNFILVSLLNNLTCYSWFSIAYWCKEDKLGNPLTADAKKFLRKYEPLSCPIMLVWYLLWIGLCLGKEIVFFAPLVAYTLWNIAFLLLVVWFSKHNADRTKKPKVEEEDEDDDMPKAAAVESPHCSNCCPHTPSSVVATTPHPPFVAPTD